jgi:hypothetical protein
MAEMAELWVIKVLYDRNATDGLEILKTRDDLAQAVAEHEAAGGRVKVFKCTPVEHEVFALRFGIQLEGEVA